jgi:hypothetical protein
MPTELDPTKHELLLRRFEPILRFTSGEQFLPADAEAYICECSLWEQNPRRLPVCLVRKGELTPERLGSLYGTNPTSMHYLKFIEPLSVAGFAAHQIQRSLGLNRGEREVFRAGFGRLARVGYVARFIDALFSLVLLTRGRVPGSASAAAGLRFAGMREAGVPYRYYGRVVQQGQWVVLQYWFFYYFNNWRSGFYGANDHEGDWETIAIYLPLRETEQDPGTVQPEWVAFAAHDHHGDDLRRHWQDPEIGREGDHPTVFVGAGSHASYFQPGEYLTELTLSFLAPVVSAAEAIRGFWRKRFRAASDDEPEGRNDAWAEILRVPFVDYARGDGVGLGPGQQWEWDPPVVINEPPPWMTNYRGLWGLFTGDPFDGEDAPGGALYNRDGTLRRAWFDPLGWCGLDRVPPARELWNAVTERKEAVETKNAELRSAITSRAVELAGLASERTALQVQPDLGRMFEESDRRAAQLGAELTAMRGSLARDELLCNSLTEFATRIRDGYQLPLRDHLRRPAQPASRAELRSNRFADFWAAASIGSMLIGLVALIIFARQYLVTALIAAAFLVALIESWFKHRFASFVTNVALLLAFIALVICVYHFLWPAITILVLVLGVYILWENLRELWN